MSRFILYKKLVYILHKTSDSGANSPCNINDSFISGKYILNEEHHCFKFK